MAKVQERVFVGILAEILEGEFDGYLCHVVKLLDDNVIVDVYNPIGDNFYQVVSIHALKVKQS